MKVLVTGGAGFIGTHLVDRLLAEGHRVLVLDKEVTGRPGTDMAPVEIVRGDVTRPEDLEGVFGWGPDAVCHLAGQVSIIRSFDDPVTDLRTNTEGTVNVLRMCLQRQVPRLLYASSMTVYGDAAQVPTPESEPGRPDSYYGITKYAAERYVYATAQRSDLWFDLHVTSFRMFSVYGPGQALDNPYQGVLGIFLGNVLRGEPITVYGDGQQTRDFVYVGDVVRAWATALEEPASFGRVFNLGSGRPQSINELADRVLAAFGRSRATHAVHQAPARPGDQRLVQADITEAGSRLGWRPEVAFENGLTATVRWAIQQNPGGWAADRAVPCGPE